jgi:16S rRNA (cytidine1402-2'-O)-methyltransferase
VEVEIMAQTPSNSISKSKRDSKLVQSGPASPSAKNTDLTAIKRQIEGGLWLVATPIGNLGDFSPRAAKTLQSADLILAEDTRVTRKLMNLHGLSGRVERCDEASTAVGAKRALEVLTDGGAVVFCADAGTPGISDPGQRLARLVIDAGFEVRSVPGASAALAALTISGLPTTPFMFAGFAPPKAGARSTFFGDLARIKATLVFYESGPRLAASLRAMLEAFGDRPACVARELTKLFEQTKRDTLANLAAHYAAEGGPKGEIVVVVGGAPDVIAQLDEDNLDALLLAALATDRVKDAATKIAKSTGLPPRDVYARAVTLSKQSQQQ